MKAAPAHFLGPEAAGEMRRAVAHGVAVPMTVAPAAFSAHEAPTVTVKLRFWIVVVMHESP
jgi:hypothetical protein